MNPNLRAVADKMRKIREEIDSFGGRIPPPDVVSRLVRMAADASEAGAADPQRKWLNSQIDIPDLQREIKRLLNATYHDVAGELDAADREARNQGRKGR